MKPRCVVKINGTDTLPHTITVIKKGHKEAETANITIENTDNRYLETFYSYLPNTIEIYLTYEEWKQYNWYRVFSGFTDMTNFNIAPNGSIITFEARSKLSILIDDTITHKWENANIHKVIKDLNSGYFALSLNCPNYFIGDLIMENKSRWEQIVELADSFGLDTYLTNDNTLYFGVWRQTNQTIYQFLLGYPDDFQNSNMINTTIKHQTSQFPYNKVEVVKWSDDKKLYSGVAESSIPRITGKTKTQVIDNKFVTSDLMAKELAIYNLWKMEREYIQIEFDTPGIPYLEADTFCEVVNAGPYSGFYWIKELTQDFSADRYTTNLLVENRDPKAVYNG
jgi:hypothetical protein